MWQVLATLGLLVPITELQVPSCRVMGVFPHQENPGQDTSGQVRLSLKAASIKKVNYPPQPTPSSCLDPSGLKQPWPPLPSLPDGGAKR